MTQDDNRQDRGDGRDPKGRWVTSGNPKGRPRKKVPTVLDMSNPYYFSQEDIEVTIGGQKEVKSRKELLLLKIYESAMKGRISAQRFLHNIFKEESDARQGVRLQLQKWSDIMDRDPERVSPELLKFLHRAAIMLEEEQAMLNEMRRKASMRRK